MIDWRPQELIGRIRATIWPGLLRLHRRTDWAAVVVCGIAVAVALALLFSVGRYLYVGTVAPGLAMTLSASCGADTADSGLPCDLLVQELGYGRFRMAVRAPNARHVQLTLRPESAPGVLLLRRSGASGTLGPEQRVAVLDAQGRPAFSLALQLLRRDLLPLAADPAGGPIRISVERRADDPAPIVLDEIGLYRSAADVGPHWLLTQHPEPARARLGALLILLLVLAMRASLASVPTRLDILVAVTIAAAGLVSCCMILAQTNGPDWWRDLRVTLAAGALLEDPGANANYGIHMAASILEGKGPLIAGEPPWHRMPAYGYLLALAAPSGDLMQLAMHSVVLHVALIAIALGALVYALTLIAPLWAAALIGCVLALLPKTPQYTQIEGLMTAVAMLVLAAGCFFVADVERRGSARLRAHLLLHAAFALWFATRADVLPGWAIVSLILYAYPPRRWPLLAIPVGLALAVAIPWAFFKQPFIHEFSPTTNSFGASLMVGQWEVPHPFSWRVDDNSYAEWTRLVGLHYQSKAASDLAVREVLRFWVIFPGYLVSLAWHGFMDFWTNELASGNRVFRSLSFAHGYAIAAITVIAVAVAAWHRPLRLLLLGWILFFNVPLFFVIYSSGGRFYNPGLVCLTLLCLLLVLDREFYASVLRRPLRSGVVAACGLAVFLLGEQLDSAMIASDGFRFATPFAAKNSTLIAYAATTDEPNVEPETIGQPVPLDALRGASGATARRTDSAWELSRSGPGPIATILLPPRMAESRHCRIRLALTVTRGELAANVQTPAGDPLLETPPRARAAIGGTSLEFNVPVADALADQRPALSLALDGAASAGTAARLNSIVLYRCGP